MLGCTVYDPASRCRRSSGQLVNLQKIRQQQILVLAFTHLNPNSWVGETRGGVKVPYVVKAQTQREREVFNKERMKGERRTVL